MAGMRRSERETAQVSAARVVIGAHGGPPVPPSAFFRRNPDLVAYAGRARDRGLPALSFLWLDGPQVWRCDVETTGSPPGRVAMMLAEAVPAPYDLTPRELQVLTLIAGGLTNVEICARLHTSRRTAATHVEHILAKLGQATRSGAAAMAIGNDLLLLPLPAGTALDGLPIAALADSADGTPIVASHRAVRRHPVRLGSIYPLTGAGDGDGLAMRRGAALAVEELNARGGVGGRRVEHLPLRVDTADPGAALRAVDDLLSTGVDAITFGHLLPEQQVPALERAAGLGAPVLNSMVSPAVSARVRADPHLLGHTFQVSATEDAYVGGFVRSMTRLRDSGEWRPRNDRLLPILRDTFADPSQTGPLVALAERHG
jgi:branched-chain amino acid transport system substrate-binding protein